MFKSFTVFVTGAIALLYIVNPTAGLIEILPDNLPLVGNLDEAGATVLLIASLNYFGVDLTSFWNKKKEKEKE